jgi:hypothetical protein
VDSGSFPVPAPAPLFDRYRSGLWHAFRAADKTQLKRRYPRETDAYICRNLTNPRDAVGWLEG